MKIELQKLTLTNFKGIRTFSTTFEHVTNISGDNATGKTTLKDAFLWLFFGKDSSDRKDFEIKTLDENNQPYHNLDHEVSATINLDGEEIVIRRSMRENWVKKRGTSVTEFSGHSTAFFWNDVPMKESEFNAKVASVFNENIFKLITNTEYFNSLKWQDRRVELSRMAGAISNDDVLASIKTGGDFTELIKALSQKKTVEDFKKEIAVKKTKIKQELEFIPSRIDEANRSLPEPVDYEMLESVMDSVQNQMQLIDQSISSESEAQKAHQQKQLQITREIGQLKQQVQVIETEQKAIAIQNKANRAADISNLKNEIRIKTDEKNRLLIEYNNDEKNRLAIELVRTELKKEWEELAKKKIEFNHDEFQCPACKRPLETVDIAAKTQELENNFNLDKSTKLEEIANKGKALADRLKIIEASQKNKVADGQVLKASIETLQTNLLTLETNHMRLTENETEEVENNIQSFGGYQQLIVQIGEKSKLLDEKLPDDNKAALQAKKRELQAEIDGLNKKLATREQKEKILARVNELKDQEATLAQELMTLEGTEFSIDQFIRAKMDTLENRINGRFKIVRFKMFETQINGGQVEACTTLIKGVPYADANAAAKIQAGLDIINTLSEHYNVYGPVWVDNRESVVSLPETEAQIINLIVDEKFKKLTVSFQNELATV